MREVNCTVVRTNISQMLEEVRFSGETFVILKNGRPVAQLVPIVQDARLSAALPYTAPVPLRGDVKRTAPRTLALPTQPTGQTFNSSEEMDAYNARAAAVTGVPPASSSPGFDFSNAPQFLADRDAGGPTRR